MEEEAKQYEVLQCERLTICLVGDCSVDAAAV